jgi:hypothetical protein
MATVSSHSRGLLVLAITLYFFLPALAQPIRCEVTSKFACSPGGCHTNKLGAFNLIDFDRRKFFRCDSKGCDDYDVVISQPQGQYIIVDIPGRGVFAKLSNDGSEYVEVTSVGTVILVSFGRCRRG